MPSSSSSSSSSSFPGGPYPAPPLTPPENETCPAPDSLGVDNHAFSEYPVRYSNGELQLFETDLQVPGAAGPWTQRRQYSNLLKGTGKDVGVGGKLAAGSVALPDEGF